MYVWRNYVWHVCLEKWNSIFSMNTLFIKKKTTLHKHVYLHSWTLVHNILIIYQSNYHCIVEQLVSMKTKTNVNLAYYFATNPITNVKNKAYTNLSVMHLKWTKYTIKWSSIKNMTTWLSIEACKFQN